MLRGNLLVDMLIGVLAISCGISVISLCVQSYYHVEECSLFFNKWQVEEYDCEVWCDSFWFLND